MSTIYTFNNKVLKNSANDKWLTKKEAPAIEEVTIGSQTWKVKNLAIDDGGTGITIVDNVTANGVNFGTQYFYTWDAAIRVANSIEGWHLPSKAEWETLAAYVGGASVAGIKLKSTTGWNDNTNGTDDFGFTALPVGNVVDGALQDNGKLATFWIPTLSYGLCDFSYFSNYSTIKDEINYSTTNNTNGYSVRLIKDT